MPNIIEQQDLLKGLPDNRLALLLQNPVADIPPFLVAAEAQRRQAIRQQFSAEGSKESVVDSLTKQLAKVPENINAPMQAPPVIPQTPDMAGVAALQQQQAMQQAAMDAQQQGMRAGGRVQRYAAQGLVSPRVGDRVQEIADQFGVSVEDAANMLKNNPSLMGDRTEEQMGTPFDIKETNVEPPASPIEFNIPGMTTSIAAERERQKELFRQRKYNEMDTYGGYTGAPFKPASGMTPQEIAQEQAAMLRRVQMSSGGKEPTPPEEEALPEDEIRKRLEELYAAQEPSNWEKAQRWFAMSEQFLDPSKTTLQSLAGAGSAFAEQSARMKAAKRQAKIEQQKALLEYDINKKNKLAETAAAERERTTMSAEKYADVLSRRLDAIDKIIADQEDSRAKELSSGGELGMPLTQDEQNKINKRYDDKLSELKMSREEIAGTLASLGETAYGPVKYDTYNLGKGFKP